MSENNIITLTDENGQDVRFEVVADFDYNDCEYCVLYPLDDDTEEALLFKVVEEAEAILEVFEDDEEFSEVANYYEEEIMMEDN